METGPPSKRQRISDSRVSNTEVTFPQYDGATDSENESESQAGSQLLQLKDDPASDHHIQREAAAGINAFVCPNLPGFEGLLKKRYTDFLVNEILPNGEVLHLQNLRPPKVFQPTQGSQTGGNSAKDLNETNVQDATGKDTKSQRNDMSGSNEASAANGNPNATVHHHSENDQTLLRSAFTKETMAAIESLYLKIIRNPQRKPGSFGPVKTEALPNKDLRTKIHRAIRNAFDSKLESQTKEDDTIVITMAPTSKTGRGGNNYKEASLQRGSLGWAELGGEWLHFTIFKENKDTMELIYFLATQAKVNVKHFQFGGTKDRRAVTVQRASAYRLRAEQLVKAGQRLRQAKIGDFEYRPAGLELGDLAGNEFVITLRDCKFPNHEGIFCEESLPNAHYHLSKLVEQFKIKGFLNYYGLQRFGSFSTGTDVVGTKLLRGDLKGAVEAILSFNPSILTQSDGLGPGNRIPSDDKARAEAISVWNTTGDSSLALQKLPRKFSAESNIIRHLGLRDRKTGVPRMKDFQGALQTIPRNLRLMYIHAYQSLVWNVVAGKRWELYGGKVVEGDLVLVHEHKDKEKGLSIEHEVDEEGEAIVRPDPDDSAADPDSFTRARTLTKDEVQSGLYNIFDVVLPLPGFDIIYPANAVGEEYKIFMASERGGGLDPYNMRRSWKDLSLSGSYRKLLGRPGQNMSFEAKFYGHEDEQLVETDIDRLGEEDQSTNEKEILTRMGSDEDEQRATLKKLAVILRMQLGPSQYATMALRELMKSGLKAYKPDFSGGR